MATRSFSRVVSAFAAFGLATCAIGPSAFAVFPGPTTWFRPTTLGEASANQTTYQEWQRFSSAAGPNTPNDGFTGDSTATFALDGLSYVNPNDGAGAADDANAFDTANATSGAFITGGGNLYSPGGVIKPRIVFDGYDLPGEQTTFVINLRSAGSEITVADAVGVTALSVNGTSVQNLPGHSYQRLFSEALGGFGGTRVDHQWIFTAPDAALFTLDWDWGVSSASLDAVTIDTLTDMPEPASLGLLAAGGLLASRRGHRRRAGN